MAARCQTATALRRSRALIDAHTHVGIDSAHFLNGDFPYAQSGEDLALRLSAQGLGAALCFPFVYSAYFRLAPYRRGRFVRDPSGPSPIPYQFENERLCREIDEAFPHLAGTLLPFAFFDPARRPAAQAAFLRDLAGRHAVFGLKTATSYLHSHIAALLDVGAPLLDTAAALDVPVTIHSAVLPGDPWANVFEILRVVEARPDVRFAIAHTCRFDQRALERAAALDNCFVDLSAFHIHCTLAVQGHPAVAAPEHRFPADYRDHAEAMQRITEAYPDTMLWGSDTPAHYWKSRFRDEHGQESYLDLACDPTTEVDELRKLPADVRERIAHTNTLRFLFGAAGREPAAGGAS